MNEIIGLASAAGTPAALESGLLRWHLSSASKALSNGLCVTNPLTT